MFAGGHGAHSSALQRFLSEDASSGFGWHGSLALVQEHSLKLSWNGRAGGLAKQAFGLLGRETVWVIEHWMVRFRRVVALSSLLLLHGDLLVRGRNLLW